MSVHLGRPSPNLAVAHHSIPRATAKGLLMAQHLSVSHGHLAVAHLSVAHQNRDAPPLPRPPINLFLLVPCELRRHLLGFPQIGSKTAVFCVQLPYSTKAGVDVRDVPLFSPNGVWVGGEEKADRSQRSPFAVRIAGESLNPRRPRYFLLLLHQSIGQTYIILDGSA